MTITNLSTPAIPFGLCHCGCGKPAPIAKRTNTCLGHIKGQPTRYLVGHHLKFVKGAKKPANRTIHFDDGVTVIALERRNGDVLSCYIDTTDYDTVKGYRWHVFESKRKRTFYAATSVSNHKNLFMHNLLLPPDRGRTPDHINGQGFDNRRQNLRLATSQQQMMNQGLMTNNRSGFKGVSLQAATGKYTAHIRIKGKSTYLGSFTRAEDAAVAYDQRARGLYGEFAALNFSATRAA